MVVIIGLLVEKPVHGVNDADRARVYDRMAALVPPPKGVTRDGVLRLDQQMLNQWRDEIDTECQSLPEAARAVYFRVRNGVHRRLRALPEK